MKGMIGGPPKWIALLASVVSISVSATTAHAAEPPNEARSEIVAKERPVTRSFYGWQILATGGAGGLVAAAATALPESPLKDLPSALGFLFGMPFYIMGGPATHWTHGDFEKGLISLSGNVVLPVVGGFVGQGIRCAESAAPDDCGTSGFFTGFAIALVTAPVIDALVLGWEDIPDDDPAPSVVGATDTSASALHRARAKPVARFALTPAWNFGPKGEISLGVAGRF